MTQAEIEKELQTLRSNLNVLTERAQSRETEWRRLGLIARVMSVLCSLTGAGLMIANVTVERTASNANFHDQLVMMGIVFLLLGMPLMIIGQALRTPGQK
jgi:transcriptional regulator